MQSFTVVTVKRTTKCKRSERADSVFCSTDLRRAVGLWICPWGKKLYLRLCSAPFTMTYFAFLQRTYQNDDSFTSSEDSLLGHHRNRATISATSSTATFITGSTDSRIANIHKHHHYNQCRDNRMSTSTRKEINLLLTIPQVPDLSTGDDSSKNKVTAQEPSIQDNRVSEIIAHPDLTNSDSATSSTGSSAKSDVQIKWGPQVSSFYT